MLPDSAKTHDPVKKFETLTKSANVLALIEGTNINDLYFNYIF